MQVEQRILANFRVHWKHSIEFKQILDPLQFFRVPNPSREERVTCSLEIGSLEIKQHFLSDYGVKLT